MNTASTEGYVQNATYVYFRNIDRSLGVVKVSDVPSHKDAILEVKELLVQGGDCLTNKAVLAVIEGGNNGQ